MAARKPTAPTAPAAAAVPLRIEPADPATIYAEQIKAAWRENVFAVVETGQLLIKAKKELGYGHWMALFNEDKLPFGDRTADCLMAVGRDPRIRTNGANLPSSWRTLYDLTRLTDQDFDYLLRVGTVTPELTRDGLAEAVWQLQGADRDENGEPIFKTLPDGRAEPIRLPPPRRPGFRQGPLPQPLIEDHSPLAADERRELLVELGTLMQINSRRAGGGIGFVRGEGAKRADEILRQLDRPDEDDGAADDAPGPGDSDEWWTPEHILERVRMVFPIDLDPASCDEAQEVVQATRFFTKAEDGLKQDWEGNTFLNATYSNQTPWTHKLIMSYQSGTVPQAILLTNGEIGAKWYQLALHHCSAYCSIRGRLKFRSKNGTIGTQPRWSSVVFYFGPNIERFFAAFGDLGEVSVPYKPLSKIPALYKHKTLNHVVLLRDHMLLGKTN
jgi:hypothetical protein